MNTLIGFPDKKVFLFMQSVFGDRQNARTVKTYGWLSCYNRVRFNAGTVKTYG